MKSEERKSTCSLDGSYKLERKLRHCERREKRPQCIFKLGSRLFAQTSQTAIEINTRAHPQTIKTQWGRGGERGAGHADPGPALRAPTYAQETIPSVCNPRKPQEFLGGRVWEIMQPIPPAFNRSHTYAHRLSWFKKQKKQKKNPEIYFQNNKGNTKNWMHFRGFPSRETVPNGGWGEE